MKELNEIEEKNLLTREEKIKFWGKGEWCDEPDLVSFSFKGHECIIRRIMVPDGPRGKHIFGGYLCGYVITEGKYADWDEISFDVHGGITHMGYLIDIGKSCIGFDCSHFCDLIPSKQKRDEEIRKEFNFLRTKTYKNIGFVKKELESLVSHLIEWKDEKNDTKNH